MSGGLTLVLGASPDPSRYSHLAIRRLREAGKAVIAIGARPGSVMDVRILREPPEGVDIDTVTVYLNPGNLEVWKAAVLRWKPRRIIFNPGAKDPGFAAVARAEGVEVVDACTLVMLATGHY